MGEGMLPIPQKVVKRILELAFVEMGDLMPEVWMREEEEASVSRNVLILPKKRVGPVTDMGQWVQRFASFVSVLSTRYPKAVPELMAYMATIVKCSKDYHGVAWAQYDRGFRKQMATLRGSRINPTLFSLCFSDKVRRNTMCNWCLAQSYDTDSCPENPPQAEWKGRGGECGCPKKPIARSEGLLRVQ